MLNLRFAALVAAEGLLLGRAVGQNPSPVPTTLNITAIATNQDHESILQCWQLKAPFKASSAGAYLLHRSGNMRFTTSHRHGLWAD